MVLVLDGDHAPAVLAPTNRPAVDDHGKGDDVPDRLVELQLLLVVLVGVERIEPCS